MAFINRPVIKLRLCCVAVYYKKAEKYLAGLRLSELVFFTRDSIKSVSQGINRC